MLHRQLPLSWQSSARPTAASAARRIPAARQLHADNHHHPRRNRIIRHDERRPSTLLASSHELYTFLWRSNTLPTCSPRRTLHTTRSLQDSSADDAQNKGDKRPRSKPRIRYLKIKSRDEGEQPESKPWIRYLNVKSRDEGEQPESEPRIRRHFIHPSKERDLPQSKTKTRFHKVKSRDGRNQPISSPRVRRFVLHPPKEEDPRPSKAMIRYHVVRSPEEARHYQQQRYTRGGAVSGTVIVPQTPSPPDHEMLLANVLDVLPAIQHRPSGARGNIVAKPSLLLLFTPAFAQRLVSPSGQPDTFFVEALVKRLISTNTYRTELSKLSVGVAVVDKLPAPRSRRHARRDGYEGVAYAVVDSMEAIVDEDGGAMTTSDDVGSGRLLKLRLVNEGGAELLGGESALLKSYEIQIPLANTVFQAGTESILQYWEWEGKLNSDHRAHKAQGATTINATINLSHIAAEDAVARVSAPLKPLTEPRVVEASMGNIIRQLRRGDGAGDVLPASAELESAVNGMVARGDLPAGPVAVWALIVKKDVYARLEQQHIALPALLSPEAQSSQQNIDQGSPNPSSKPKRPGYPNLTAILQEGGRLHRVMSGGGGWGKKAGLLSINPAVAFEQQSEKSEETNALPPWMRSVQDINEALGSPVEPGDRIQLFLAESRGRNASSPTSPGVGKAKQMLDFGTVPSSVDVMPQKAAEDAGNQTSSAPAKLLPRIFGALSERGFGVSGANVKGDSMKTLIDVPYSRLSMQYALAATGEETSSRDPSVSASIRKVLQDVHNPEPKIRYHIKTTEDMQSAETFRRAVNREQKKIGLQKSSSIDEASANASAIREALPVTSNTSEPTLVVETGAGEIAGAVNADGQSSQLSQHSIRPQKEKDEEYDTLLASLSDEELKQEKVDLAKAIKKAKQARRKALTAIEHTRLPSDPYLAMPEQFEESNEEGVGDDMDVPNISKISSLSFAEMYQLFLKHKSELEFDKNSQPKAQLLSEKNKTKFWIHRGFPPALVAMLTEYHSLPPELPKVALESYGKPPDLIYELPFATLRAATQQMSAREERQFWRKWSLFKRTELFVRLRSRAEYKRKLFAASQREQLQAKYTSETEALAAEAAEKESANDLSPEFRAMLFRVLGNAIKEPFHRQHAFYFNQGLALDTRAKLWSKPATSRVLHAMFQWLARINYMAGDSVGKALGDSIAWNSSFTKSHRFQAIQKAEPKLLVKYDSGDAEDVITSAKGIRLMFAPVRTYEKLMPQDSRRVFSVRHPWEFLYRFLSVWPEGEIPESIDVKRTKENRWNMKIAIAAIAPKLGVIFQKFDDAINAHGDKPGRVEVDIGKEVRELFPSLLRTKAGLTRDLLINRPAEEKATTSTSTRPRRLRVRRIKSPLIRKQTVRPVRHARQSSLSRLPVLRRIPLGSSQSSQFQSQWKTNPNTFAFDLMAKRMKDRVRKRIMARLGAADARSEKHAEVAARPDILEGEGERDVDYDLMERSLERKLDRMGYYQSNFRQLKLEPEDQRLASASSTDSATAASVEDWWKGDGNQHLVSQKSRKSMASRAKITRGAERRRRGMDKRGQKALTYTTEDPLINRVEAEPREKSADELREEEQHLRRGILKLLKRI